MGGILHGRHPVRGEVDSQALATTGAWPSQVVFAALLKFSWFCGGLLCKLYHSREYIPRPKQARANELIAEGGLYYSRSAISRSAAHNETEETPLLLW